MLAYMLDKWGLLGWNYGEDTWKILVETLTSNHFGACFVEDTN